METTVKNTLNNEDGMIMVVVLIILVIITVLGLTASRTAVTEMQIATNYQQSVDELCDAEGGLISALEIPATWMTDPFLSADPITVPATFTGPFNFDGLPGDDATVEIRCIEDTTGVVVPVPGLTAAANDVPVSPHITPPPAGSGYSMKYFEARRYAVTATSSTGNTQVQAGVFRVFNKF